MDKTSDQVNSSISSNKEELSTEKLPKATPKRKPPFKKKAGPLSFSKNQHAKFQQLQSKSIIFTSALLTFFPLHTELTGAPLVAGILYDILNARDYDLNSFFSRLELQYVTLLATYYRAALVVNKSKTAVIHGLGILKESIANVLLPDVLWSYIETLGIVNLTSTIQVVPFFRDYSDMRTKSYFVDCYDYLTREQQQDALPRWSINDDVITKVVSGMSRALKGILELRSMKTELDGHLRFVCAYREAEFLRIIPLCVEQIDINDCKLGACYRFRSSDKSTWEDSTLRLPLVHEAQPVEEERHLTQVMLSQLRFN